MGGSATKFRDNPHQVGVGSVSSFAIQLPLGVVWVTCGVCSYGLLSLASRYLLHSEQAALYWRMQVPTVVYDRSLFMFATAFLIDILTMCFEYKSSRLDMVLLPAFIKGMATVTNTLVRAGWGAVGEGEGGSMVMIQRYICWMHTTPTILLLVKMISNNITKQQVVRAVLCVEVMLITGLAGALGSGWLAGLCGLASHVAFLPLLPYLHQGLSEAGCIVSLHAAGHTMTLVYYITMMMWVTFGLVWDLRMLGFLSTDVEEVVYLCCDFAAKVMFSSGLMLSSFKGMDSRREGVMRQIQETHRQTLIQELKRVIEQKDAFMSSVSHELRTPLNGIIGISEGLLSGCCGTLNESVRRQIYIVRTSGARLLALINDVMDAAALRQHRLVLKQERLDLRQVVGDVSDLTRSLVDNDVSLRNEVPEGMLVWADSGRMIQILNNLLGNAAKFTHQGVIRVSASWYDEQHQWAAIHVTDTGIGIPKQKLASIFLPFEQVDGSISRQYGGFGLGLSITQELVKAHGGELWVKSKEGKGSSFTFTLPSFTGQTQHSAAQPAAHQAGVAITAPIIRANSLVALNAARANGQDASADYEARAGDPSAEYDSCASEEYTSELPYDAAQLSALASSKPFTASSAATVGASPGNSQPTTAVPAGCLMSGTAAKRDARPTQFVRTGRYQVLSVDDDQVNQTVVQSLLSSTGYEVVTLSSGRQMLDYLDECEVLPDLILLDVMMPDMSGPEVCAQLATRPKPLPVPVIMVSAHTDEAVVVKGLDSGADDYITKPFRREEFLARIRAKLQLSPGVVMKQALVGHAGDGDPVVMCVDDDEVNHIVLEGMLHSQNYRYLKARSGAEALQLLDQSGSRPPHLVLLDASLPDTTGLDVLQQLRSRYSQVALPVVMLTARHNERAIVAALDTGANDYAVKPFRRSELLARIRMHLRSSQRAAAAAAEPTDVAPVAAALAQADQDLSAELKQLLPATDQLKTMPLLVAQLSGLEVASAGLSPEQLSVLLGIIADTFDATVEKYAMLKVEANDSCLTVAAPSISSTNNSARSSLQQEQQASGSTQQLQQPVMPDARTAAQATPASAMLQQLLKLSHELLTAFGLSDRHPVDQVAAQQADMTAGSASSSPVQSQLPPCCKGVLQLRVALHVGGLHAGVVGARRPRYRLLGPALHLVKQAAAAAPANSIVATAAAASHLVAIGTKLTLMADPWPGAEVVSGSGGGMKQLWLVAASSVNVCGPRGPTPVCLSTDQGGITGDVEAARQAQPTRQQQLPSSGPYLPLPVACTRSYEAQQQQQQQQLDQTQSPSTVEQHDLWTSVLLRQQQQVMALTAQLAATNGISDSAHTQAAGVGLGLSSWLDGLAALGLNVAPADAALPLHAAAAGGPPCSESRSSAAVSVNSKTATRSVSNVSSASADAQTLHHSWCGPLAGSMSADGGAWWNGQGCTVAGVECAAALGALAGWQLGPTEVQQMLMIQQELDQILQQLAAVTGGNMPCPSFFGCWMVDSCAQCSDNGWSADKGAGSGASSPANRPPQADPTTAAAALALATGHTTTDAASTGDEQHQGRSSSSSTAGQLSPPHESYSESGRVSMPIGHNLELLIDRHSGGSTVAHASMGQLLKRRSHKQKSSAT